jgi:hypothetical protein
LQWVWSWCLQVIDGLNLGHRPNFIRNFDWLPFTPLWSPLRSFSFFLVNLVCCGVTNSFFTVAMTSVSTSFFLVNLVCCGRSEPEINSCIDKCHCAVLVHCWVWWWCSGWCMISFMLSSVVVMYVPSDLYLGWQVLCFFFSRLILLCHRLPTIYTCNDKCWWFHFVSLLF